MHDELARALVHFASGMAAAAGVIAATRLLHWFWPDPDAIDAQARITALQAELVAVREDSRELVRRTRERIAVDLGKPKDSYKSWKVGDN
jgi:hypothetical protein